MEFYLERVDGILFTFQLRFRYPARLRRGECKFTDILHTAFYDYYILRYVVHPPVTPVHVPRVLGLGR